MDASPNTPSRTRERIVLMIADGIRSSHPLDALRLMEACFIVSHCGRRQWRAAFKFAPDAFRPVDPRVHRGRDALLARGLLLAEQYEGHPAYSLSEEGEIEADRVRDELGDDDADWLARVGAYVTSRPYGQLVDEVHGPRPEFVVRSLVAR